MPSFDIPSDSLEVHISSTRSYRTCRRKYKAEYLYKRVSKTPNIHFLLGTIFHEVFELNQKGISPDDSFAGVFARNTVDVPQNSDYFFEASQEALKLKQVINEYFAYWNKNKWDRWSDDKFEFVALEQGFKIPLPNLKKRGTFRKDAFLAGRIDGIIRRKEDNTYWLWENKTSSRPDSLIGSLFNDEQSGAYLIAASYILGQVPEGVVYNVVNKSLPTQPKVLKDGTLSKDKSINTTNTTYREAIDRQHPDWTLEQKTAEYGEFVKFLATKPNNFYIRKEVRRTKTELDQLLINLSAIVDEMTDVDTPMYPNPNPNHCNYCSFKRWCETVNQFGPTSQQARDVLEIDFDVKKAYTKTEIELSNVDN